MGHKTMKRQQVSTDTDPAQNAYIGALKGQRTAFAVVIGFSAVVNILMLTGSIYMLQVYDRVLSSGSIPTLVGLFGIVVVLFGFLGLFDFLRSRLLARIALRLDLALGPDAFKAWLKANLKGRTAKDADATAPQVMRHLGSIRTFLSSPTASSVFDVPFVPIFLIAMFLIHPWLGLMVVAGACVTAAMALTGWFLARKPQSKGAALEVASQEFSNHSHASADTITAMGMQGFVTHHWQKMHNAALASQQQASNPSEVIATSSKTFRMLLQSTILTVGALLVLQNQISAGMIIASSVLSARALAPIDQVIGQWRNINRAFAAHRGLSAFFDGHRLVRNTTMDLPKPTGAVTVSDLTKLAPGKNGKTVTPLLNKVQFDLAPGDGLGVIGKSASGKSTLAHVLVGAWQAEKGDVRFDGASHDQWDPEVLGRAIGYLPQTVSLLPGTIGNNIARFDPQAKDTDVIAAAQMAGVHDMILALPDGYATPVGGHNGTPLSGGQIQRLGLARAVFGLPSVVVLDEPNANLDTDGDDALGQAITALRNAGSTVIVMAHRPSAIAAVNKVMILHEGRMVRFDDKEKVLGGPQVVKKAADVTALPKGTAVPSGDARTAVPPTPPIRTSPEDYVAMASTKLARILDAERARGTDQDPEEPPKMYKSS